MNKKTVYLEVKINDQWVILTCMYDTDDKTVKIYMNGDPVDNKAVNIFGVFPGHFTDKEAKKLYIAVRSALNGKAVLNGGIKYIDSSIKEFIEIKNNG